MVAVSILIHLAAPPYILPSLNPRIFTSLVSLFTRCLNAATSAACAAAALNKDRKPSTTPGATPTISGGGEREGEAGEGQEPPSIPELLGLISYCRGPSVVSTITARTLAHDIAVLTVSPLPSCVYIRTH